ncbi:thioredoxin-related protein [Neolewinella xylanilytica]|uniref:Thioredoxin-related protein n=1 Tax=Neolewinella xylanilytica TaxID=1514080 RepID=A0A2S6I4W4_9BACT|nr:thioredoxin family protein [Neolewinella xylanilytica]PPK86206.1 thioredoxin-related protein [Neolewinella xylanilytica]
MKAILLILLLGAYVSASAQQWVSDYDAALQTAAEEDKAVVLVFSGSDWCAPCIKLDRDIWQDASFQERAAKAFVFYRADFPRKKENQLSEALAEKNAQLAERYNQRGAFPLVVVLNPEGEVLGQTGYKKLSPTEYLEILESFVP